MMVVFRFGRLELRPIKPVVAGAFSLAGTSATYHVTRSPKYGYDRAK
jgi:hypothetical protein